jgi:hypothetical protein
MFLGRHPCAGIKIAKLEIKLVLAMMLLGYEYELVDGKGRYLKAVPEQDRNDLLQVSRKLYICAATFANFLSLFSRGLSVIHVT